MVWLKKKRGEPREKLLAREITRKRKKGEEFREVGVER
jgi:hypothetical protein